MTKIAKDNSKYFLDKRVIDIPRITPNNEVKTKPTDDSKIC